MRVLNWKELVPYPVCTECDYHYGLVIEEVETDGFSCESYGFLITDERTGTGTRCRHITVNAHQAMELMSKLVRCQVSPVHLLDVIEDHFGA